MTGRPLPRAHHLDIDVEEVAALKAATGVVASVCLPARNERATIASIVVRLVGHPLVDEVVVVDDHSTDATADEARAAGAIVVAAAEVLPDHGQGPGKGQALWKAVASSRGDVIAFCDADVRDFDERFPTGLLGPLIADPEVAFVKSYYERPADGLPRGGGRVTELAARPILHLLFPELAAVVQPLSGEFAGRRALLESVPFVSGYGVDIALLIDVARTAGVERIVQVDLGRRVHRNRPLDQLGPMAVEVLQAALRRAGTDVPDHVVFERPDADVAAVRWAECPPLAGISSRPGEGVDGRQPLLANRRRLRYGRPHG